MVECRGAIHHLQCTAPCADLIWDAESETVNIEESTFRALEPLPQCRNCPALARPNILMFRGPVMWLGHRTDAQQQRFAGWLDGLVKSSAKPRSGEQCRLTHGFGFGLRFNGHVLLYVGEGGLRLKGQIPCPS